MPKVQTSFLTVVSCFAWQVLAVGAATPSAEQVEFFENKVRPLLIAQCYSCHSAEAEAKGKLKAGLHMDSLHGLLKGGDSGAALVPGNPEKSLLIEAINYRNEDMAMPPKAKLNDSEIQVLTEWVRLGAPWPGQEANQLTAGEKSASPYDWAKFRSEHWSFKPITKPAPPEVSDAAWPKGEIDRFVLAKLDAANLKPNPRAEKYILIRRAFLDLLGLPPSLDEVDAFLADDAPDAFARLVDGLLQHEAYGERWARHWMDVARYSDGYGGFGDANALPNAWRYRDWVVKALNADMPYDQFVTRQIAGDLLAENADPVATGFFVVGPNYQADGGDAEAKAQAEAETLYDRVDTFSRGFLGLTTACARCHDHKFDPITTKDYYAIAGIFKNTTNHEVPVVPQAQIDAFNAGQKTIQEQEGVIKTFLGEAAKRLGTKSQGS